MSQHDPHNAETDPADPTREPQAASDALAEGAPDQGEAGERLDSGQQALSDALRVSFAVLKGVMLVLLVAYLASGFFIVNEGEEQVVRLRFGQMVGNPEPTVYESGWHFGLPYPIEQQVRVPVTTQTIDLINAFWYEGQNNPNEDRLNPLEDGYLLTGDGGIVHARFQIDYTVTDPIQFIRQIKGTRAGRAANAAAARTLMRSVAEQGIARAVAQTPADAVVAGNANTGSARLYMQQRLDAMNSGLTVQSVSIQSDATLPGPVQDDYQAVTRAENTRQQKIQTAQNERERILVSAGGEAAMPGEDGQPGPLLQVIDQYQIAVRAGENDKAAQLQQRLARAMQASPPRLATADDQRVRIGGEAASVLSEARSYANQIEQTLRSEQNTFNELLSQYRQNPRILISRIWQDVREKVLTGNGIETIYSMTGKPYIVVNRDPEVQRQREQAAIEAQGQQSNQDAQ